jgi:AcrR family transcriptional regulator
MSDANSWVREISQQYDIDFENQKLTTKQRSILEAAILLFAAKGYNGTTTNEIAKQAGVAEATIFKHYRSKKGLLLRLVVPAIAKFASPFILNSAVKILEQERPIEQILEELIQDRVHLVEKNWDIFRIIIVESLFHPELREAIQKHVAKRVFSVVSDKVDHLKERGKIRKDLPTHVLIRGMMSIIFSYLFAKNVVPSILAKGEEHEELKWTVEMMLYGLNGKTAEE